VGSSLRDGPVLPLWGQSGVSQKSRLTSFKAAPAGASSAIVSGRWSGDSELSFGRLSPAWGHCAGRTRCRDAKPSSWRVERSLDRPREQAQEDDLPLQAGCRSLRAQGEGRAGGDSAGAARLAPTAEALRVDL